MFADKCNVPPAFWRGLERAGLRPEALLRQARLPATLHLNPQAPVTTAQFFALWRATEQLLPEPGLGLRLIATLETAVYPPSVLVAFSARDYRDGLARLARFKHLCTPEQLLSDETYGEFRVVVKWLHATEPAPAIATHVCFATVIELGRRGSGRHLSPLRVELAHPEANGEVFERYFDCPIRYDAAADVLVLKSADLDRPFPGHNPELLELLTPALASSLQTIQAHDSIGERVKSVLKRSLPSGRPDVSYVARDLGMSERSLQRRITEQGTTFRHLLAESRQELGRRLLAVPDTSINEVAYLLGYQDVTAFHRAFKEWEGMPPARWRDLQASAQVGA